LFSFKRLDRLRPLLIVSGFAILVIVYASWWRTMITIPSQRTGTDFIALYSAGRVADIWGIPRVYEIDLQQQIEAEVVGFDLAPGQVLLYNHMPYMVPFLMMISDGNYLASLLRYVVVMLATYLTCIVLAGWMLRRSGWLRNHIWFLLAGLLTFFPLFISLVIVQDTPIMILGAFVFLAGLVTGKDWVMGIGLALTTIRPHISLMLALPFLFRRRKVFGWFVLATSVLGAFSVAILGFAGTKTFIDILLATAGGDWFGMNEPVMVNLMGLLMRIFPSVSDTAIHTISWVAYGLTLAGLCVYWWRSRTITGKQVGIAMILTVFFAPRLHYHDLTLLVPAILILMIYLVKEDHLQPGQAGLIPLVFSLFLTFSFLIPILKYNAPFVIMFLMLIAFLFPRKMTFLRREVEVQT
jgi:hypothetical protein